MANTKRYNSLKTGAANPVTLAGPRNITGTVLTQLVPCRGARAVLFHMRSTDALSPVGVDANLSNDPVGSLLVGLTADAMGVAVCKLQRMNAPGGVTATIVASGTSSFIHGFCQLSFVSNAGGHTLFDVDAEVVYDGDADDIRNSSGQSQLVPV